ncbi:MAG: type-F conjugative transfer system pilin assembly protein TrbC [Deltaproteobacteria bacterium]|nr:type-F conjugative transfer system pilin assembly protein TrbC [Deltaproteobacteria bacterium]
MNRNAIRGTVAALASVTMLAAWCGPGQAQGAPGDMARDVAEEVLRKAKRDDRRDLDGWSRSVIEDALERAGRRAFSAPAPLPAEDHARRVAGGLTTRPHGPEVIVFMSLSAPAESWRQWSREAARIGAPLVLRGLGPDGFQATVKRIGPFLDRGSGAAIDPRLFRLFDIKAVPAVAVVPDGVPPCESRGCSADPAPPHDRVAGNIGLEAALEAIASEGGPGRVAARRHLADLRGDAP